jgi:GT2 family glycosyltransferase
LTPGISILIPVFHRKRLLVDCLRSLAVQTLQPDEILWIDNGDRKIDLSDTPGIPRSSRRLDFGDNLLFAEAVNRAFPLCRGELVCILNSDTVPDRDFLRCLAAPFLIDPRCGSAHGILSDGAGRIDSCGVEPGWTLRPRDRTRLARRKPAGPPGAAFMIRRALASRLVREDGYLFDPDIPFFYADLSFARRLDRKGVVSRLVPGAKALHHRAASTPKSRSFLPFGYCRLDPAYRELLIACRAAFVKKHFEWKRDFWRLPFVWTYDGALRLVRFFDPPVCRGTRGMPFFEGKSP